MQDNIVNKESYISIPQTITKANINFKEEECKNE